MRHFGPVVLKEHCRNLSAFEIKTVTVQPLPGVAHLDVMLVVASLPGTAVGDDSLTPFDI